MSKAELLTEACKKQDPQATNNDGGLCSSCIRSHECIGGGVTTHCSGESSDGGRKFCVPLEQVGPGCRCQRSADCYGFEDQINVCRPTSTSSGFMGLLLDVVGLHAFSNDSGSKYCMPLSAVHDD